MPFLLGRPVWVEDPRFDLGYHVRRRALPRRAERPLWLTPAGVHQAGP